MALSSYARNCLDVAIGDPSFSKEIGDTIDSCAKGTKGANVPNITLTATTGSFPAASTACAVSNTGAATVVELLQLCVDLNAQILALSNAIKAYGITS